MLPILYQNKNFIFYSYPLLMGLGWGVAHQVYFSQLDIKQSRIIAHVVYWGIFIFSWIGSKFLFYLTNTKNIDQSFSEANFWLGGGFVFYGGFLAALIFIFLIKIIGKNDIDLWPMLPALVVGHAIGRIGCFLAGCCYGKETDFFWGIFQHGHHRHPTQLIEATLLFAFGIYLLKSKLNKTILVSIYLLYYGVIRLWIEYLRGDIIRGQWGYLTPSQWISLGLVLSGIGLYFHNKYSYLIKSQAK